MFRNIVGVVIGVALWVGGCTPVMHIDPGTSFTPLPGGVWTSAQVPCPYDEVGFLKFSTWIAQKTPAGGGATPAPGVPRDPKVASLYASGIPIDEYLWDLLPASAGPALAEALQGVGADALIHPHLELVQVTISADQCAELKDLGCSTKDPVSGGSTTPIQPMIIVEGLAVRWLCSTGQPIPEAEHRDQAPMLP